ncbi:transposase [Kitasatospora sp. NPDC097643]|uniref:RNA-guided endonuclease InsQ/TnpB family protein n=1 Tax=Kitasatospora sp. NPDC097643 TaxID=3157230 RepID=UPI00332E0A07
MDTPEKETTVSLERGRVGIDRGVVEAVVTSDGRMFDRAFMTPRETERHRRLSRQLQRRRTGSARWHATADAIVVLHARVRRRRADFNAKTARNLVTGCALLVLEDLNVRAMTASAAGTAERPGTGVARKRGLNRSIRDKGWFALELACRSAARTTGTVIRKVNPAYTSQTCPRCRNVDKKSRESQAVFACTSCGHREHADVVGAKNTLAAGLGGYRTWRPPAVGRVCEASTARERPAARLPRPRESSEAVGPTRRRPSKGVLDAQRHPGQLPLW